MGIEHCVCVYMPAMLKVAQLSQSRMHSWCCIPHRDTSYSAWNTALPRMLCRAQFEGPDHSQCRSCGDARGWASVGRVEFEGWANVTDELRHRFVGDACMSRSNDGPYILPLPRSQSPMFYKRALLTRETCHRYTHPPRPVPHFQVLFFRTHQN